MGMLFNSVNTVQIVNRLNHRYNDNPAGLQTHNGDDAVYLDYGTYPHLRDVANHLGLVPGNPRGVTRWLWFLDYIEPLPGPNSTIGNDLRQALAQACNNNRAGGGCTAIEFFAVPDVNASLHLGAAPNNDGTFSTIITLFTNMVDLYGAPLPLPVEH